MSEFECCPGNLMLIDDKTGKYTCPVCGGTTARFMDGKSRRELMAEENESLREVENEETEDED